MKLARRAWVTFGAAAGLAACSMGHEAAHTAPRPERTATTLTGPGPSAPEPAPAADPRPALRAAHPRWREEVACRADVECDGALRCLGGVCSWPAAMTGERTDATPMAIVSAERGEVLYYLEVADDSDEHTRGLMYRRVIRPDFGMVFVFDDESPRSFWMRNTLISLDMLFVRGDGSIDSIVENAEPRTLTPRPSAGPARYVVELAGGEAARRGIRPGQHVEFLNLGPPPRSGGH